MTVPSHWFHCLVDKTYSFDVCAETMVGATIQARSTVNRIFPALKRGSLEVQEIDQLKRPVGAPVVRVLCPDGRQPSPPMSLGTRAQSLPGWYQVDLTR